MSNLPIILAETTTQRNPLNIIFSGGVTGIAIIALLALLSMIALALVVEHLLTIRRAVLLPENIAQKVRQKVATGDLSGANTVCQTQPCALTAVLQAGLGEVPLGWNHVEKAMEETLAEQAARLLRKIDYLSLIGNIAPMVGLLGTVVGMIFAFQSVADAQGAARAADLASGIYQALVTTVGGLIVAIPSLAAFAIFRNRIDKMVAEIGHAAQAAMVPLKSQLVGNLKH
ncbi:MotA/TolQ/ExbB proton channel family protein [Adhaeretor mobilis]|uniref:Biopolymer transport protein ExbB n=1 Tax=Adhaeretor mobilis TaxID=1930276 RepID=A0A517N1S3_9BACT|nr:MotA/TolQ/ExbB proton channel family protein [Adhaeretor mobilis]QDT01075.1 Biopolymer transport protein ExbB [Adhaeretor mobilis]